MMDTTPQTRWLIVGSCAGLLVCLMAWVALGVLAAENALTDASSRYLLNLLGTATVVAVSGIFVAILQVRPRERDDGRVKLAAAYARGRRDGHAEGMAEGHAQGYAEGRAEQSAPPAPEPEQTQEPERTGAELDDGYADEYLASKGAGRHRAEPWIKLYERV